MLNSAEHEIFPAHKCYNAINCWHLNIYEQEKISFQGYLSLKKAEFLDIFIIMDILKFHAQLSRADNDLLPCGQV